MDLKDNKAAKSPYLYSTLKRLKQQNQHARSLFNSKEFGQSIQHLKSECSDPGQAPE